MKESKEFSLSFYLDELKRREDEKILRKVSAASHVTQTDIEVLKALNDESGNAIPLTTLARKVDLKIGQCQEICEHLGEGGLLEIEPDQKTGNDQIRLSAKGREIL